MSETTATARFALLRELFTLARAQRDALETALAPGPENASDDAFDCFTAILQERDAIIQRLQALTFAAATEELPHNVIPFPGAVVEDDEDLLALDTLIRGVLEHDRCNELLLQERLEAMRVELPGLDAGHRSVARYAVELPGSRFIDRIS